VPDSGTGKGGVAPDSRSPKSVLGADDGRQPAATRVAAPVFRSIAVPLSGPPANWPQAPRLIVPVVSESEKIDEDETTSLLEICWSSTVTGFEGMAPVARSRVPVNPFCGDCTEKEYRPPSAICTSGSVNFPNDTGITLPTA